MWCVVKMQSEEEHEHHQQIDREDRAHEEQRIKTRCENETNNPSFRCITLYLDTFNSHETSSFCVPGKNVYWCTLPSIPSSLSIQYLRPPAFLICFSVYYLCAPLSSRRSALFATLNKIVRHGERFKSL